MNDDTLKNPNLVYLGRPAIFYIPKCKLFQGFEGLTIARQIHKFLIDSYGGYTSQKGKITGYWEQNAHAEEHIRYEVSFVGRERISDLVDFLVALASDMDEQYIYLRMGDKSYLVKAQE